MTHVAQLYPECVTTVELAPQDADPGRLDPREASMVSGAVEKRRRQFAAGRLAARQALAELGVEEFALLAGDDRIPQWPEGLVGSISHTDDYCAVAVARAHEVVGVGLDVEVARDLGRNLWRRVLTKDEQSWIESEVEAERRGMVAKLYFSAKECAFKCQYPVSRRWLEFADVEIVPDLAGDRLEVRVLGAAEGLGVPDVVLDARYRIDERWVATGMTLRRGRG